MTINSNRLLLVDDDQLARDLMSLRLQRMGYEITVADDGSQALEILKVQNIDLVLLDMMMPGLSGYEVLSEIRKSFSLLSLPVIMVTAHDEQEHIIKALETGANDYLVKPVNMEIALARINTQLTLKSLSSMKDEFLSFASHDLKKPLMLMLDIAHTLKNDFIPQTIVSQQACEDLDLLIRTAADTKDVIEGFLNLESFRSGRIKIQRRGVNLNDIVNKLTKANASYAQKKEVNLMENLDTELPTIQADGLKIMEVLDNLIGNALKFSPKMSRTIVKTRHDESYIYVEVCDSGPGLSDDDVQNLFIKNAELSNKPTGEETSSDLGLAICKQLISLHGGEIGAKNNPERGATFWFKLPIYS